MERKKLLMIVNPNAGKKQIRSQLYPLIEMFDEAGYFVSVCVIHPGERASILVRNYGADFDFIVACGGDGTIDEVINGIMLLENRPVLGCIPTGTMNDLATTFGISRNIVEAGKQFLLNDVFDFDIGQFQNQWYFSYVAAFGMFTEVAYETSQGGKNALGRVAYLINGLKALTNANPCHAKVTYDSGSFEGEYIFGAVSNTLSVGGFQQFKNEDVALSDGQFEALFIKKPNNALGYQQIFTNFLAQNYDEKIMTFVQSSHFEIETDEKVTWILDGEDRGKHNRVSIQNIPRAISVVRKPLQAEMEDNQ